MKINGITISKHHSNAMNKARWIKKIGVMLAPLGKMSKLFTVEPKALDNVDAPVRINYLGTEGDPKDHKRQLENILDCRFDFDGNATVKKGRQSLVIELDPDMADFMLEEGEPENMVPVNVIPIRTTPKLATV
jgi:hypothetical protein